MPGQDWIPEFIASDNLDLRKVQSKLTQETIDQLTDVAHEMGIRRHEALRYAAEVGLAALDVQLKED